MEKVLLLNLPWATPLEPSLGVAILKAVYEKEGVVCDVYDTQLEMLRWVSHNTYQEISQAWARWSPPEDAGGDRKTTASSAVSTTRP